jgi:pimeloyl-ACP methyl ester carboxylesterase
MPEGYAPGLVYNLREKPEGGKLRRPGELKGQPDALTRRECLVLVHGYNNHQGEAAEAYIGFRNRQSAIFEDVDRERLEKRLGDAFWPGDAKWIGPLDWLDFMFYPFAVGVARQAAPLLAELLQRMPNLERVDFLAHSLGCRLTLETLALLRQRGYPAIGRVCLMAAAVPCDMLEPGGRFETMLWDLQGAGVEIRVLYSKIDPVLQFAFPPGQTLAGEPSMRALGRYGPPPDMPGHGATVSEHRVYNAGHSDYWGHRDNPAMEDATRDAGVFLKMGDHPRQISARAPAEPRKPDPPREIGEPYSP